MEPEPGSDGSSQIPWLRLQNPVIINIIFSLTIPNVK